MVGFLDLRIIANDRSNDLTLPKRRSIVDGRNADLVVCVLDNDGEKSITLGDYVRHLLDHIHIFATQWQ